MKPALFAALFLFPVLSYCQGNQIAYNDGKPCSMVKFIQVVDSLKSVKSSWKVATNLNLQPAIVKLKITRNLFWVNGYEKDQNGTVSAPYCFAAPGIFKMFEGTESTMASIILVTK